jgi:hypothetical protein
MRTISLLAAMLLFAACNESPSAGRDAVDAGENADAADTSFADADTPDTAVDVDPSIDTSPTDDAGPPEDASVVDTDDGPIDVGAPDTAPPLDPTRIEASCEDACLQRNADGGVGCELSPALPCREACIERGSGVDPPLFDAYIQCISTDPLCFQNILQCTLGNAYPTPFEQTVTVDATGFARFIGTTIQLGLQERPNEFVRTALDIEAAEFSVAFEVLMSVQQSKLVIWYIDMDGDGACRPDQDITGSASFDLFQLAEDADIRLPEWRIPITVDLDRDAPFVCEFL